MIVSITDDCVSCGACEVINSDVFTIDRIARVNLNNLAGNEEDCIDAALICPVNAILIDDIF